MIKLALKEESWCWEASTSVSKVLAATCSRRPTSERQQARRVHALASAFQKHLQ